MVARQNVARAEQAILDELGRALRDGFTDQEVAEAKKGILESWVLSRSQDSSVASRWSSYLDLGRNWQFSKDFEAKVMALTADEVNAAFRKYIDPDRLTVVVAADGRKTVAAESSGERLVKH